MTILVRSSVKAYFQTGNVMTAQSFIDLIDSGANLYDTTAQTFNSDLVMPNLIVTNVSTQTMGIAGRLQASAATFGGRLRQGVSAAASAANSLGDILVCQESTVAGAATAQVAFLPTTTNIAAFKLKVLVGGSAGAGGLNTRIGYAGDNQAFGTMSTSATGLFEATAVSAARMTGASGAVEMFNVGASANTNCIGVVYYYQRV